MKGIVRIYYGWPHGINFDNGSRFARSEIQTMFRNLGIMHFTAAISRPSSVGLAERSVRMTVKRLHLK